ncbi:MAG: beta-galactosidase [Actinomycetota bacterium]|nr:beta-galactosidase [Actinomycetota bacterium]
MSGDPPDTPDGPLHDDKDHNVSRFEIGEADFLLDDRPFRIISGALHYFRVHPAQWEDRLAKARHLGLNTVETYVAWNAHSPSPGEYHWDGQLDLGRFLDLVADAGLHAIVRPGPYICAEWSNGGLPPWLFQDAGTAIRCHEPAYVKAVEEYLRALAPVLVPRQVDRAGPLLLVQVENEYGAYGNDTDYLRHLVDVLRDAGITVPLTTVDQPTDGMLRAGSLPDLHRTASFGSRPDERLATLRRHQPTGPLMCSEFWDGWFDSWGDHHHVTDPGTVAADLDRLLSLGASVNLYMFHGGTNFGLTNGANDKGVYKPIVTSYDYDAPLDEAGRPTAKYWAFREVIARHVPVPDCLPRATAPVPAFEVPLTGLLPLREVLDGLGTWSVHGTEVTMDDVGHPAGFMLYRADLTEGGAGVLEVGEVRDRAQVFVDGRPVGTLSRDCHDRALSLPDGQVLELLVEDQGRVDYGPRLGEPKGLIGPTRVAGRTVETWRVLPVDLDRLVGLAPGHPAAQRPEPGGLAAGPVVATGSFDAPAGRDLFLDTAGWGKGVVWINGFCLGRYWSRGPQRTLYVPGPVVRGDGNVIVVLELHAACDRVRFVEDPDLGHTEE